MHESFLFSQSFFFESLRMAAAAAAEKRKVSSRVDG
jgi:hypothetical protein